MAERAKCSSCSSIILPSRSANSSPKNMGTKRGTPESPFSPPIHDNRSPLFSRATRTPSIEFRIIYLQGKEIGLRPEGDDQGRAAAHAAQGAAGMEAQLGEAGGTEVG